MSLAKNIQDCHQAMVIHRDIKLENVIITKNLETILIDFGYGEVIPRENYSLTRYCGTLFYMPPEIILGESYDGESYYLLTTGRKADVWSFGVLYFKMISGIYPFESENDSKKELYEQIVFKDLHFPPDFTEEDEHLIQMVLNRDPVQRANFKEIISFLSQFV